MTDQAEIEKRLKTRILNFHQDNKEPIIERREKRIDEAVNWKKGPNTANPERHVVDTLPNRVEVHFLKPGKEVDNTDPNPNDMAPRVGDLYENYRFDEIWAEISKIGIHDMEALRYFLVLVYRSAYLLDHEEIEEGKLRYRPDNTVVDAIDDKIGDSIVGTALTLLHFLDVLGWNEDVKYHGGTKDNDIRGDDFKTGRINTLLTCINIPFKYVRFINEVRSNAESPEELDLVSGLDSMQSLSSARGTSTPTNKELEEWFNPFLHTRDNQELGHYSD